MRKPLRAMLLFLALYAATGIYTVAPEERAVVRRFGRVVASNVPPGVHYRLPFPLSRLDKIKAQQVRRVSVGGELPADLLLGGKTSSAEFLTGDLNIILVEALAQFTISAPVAYLFRAADSDRFVRCALEAALTEVLAARGVDALMTTDKAAAAIAVQNRAQQTLDAYGVGVRLTSVSLGKVDPPAEVADAFRDVANARADRARLVNEAEGYARETARLARGEAQKLRTEAESYRTKKINEARGDADRFHKLAAEYRKAKRVTSERLYLEAMEEILPKIKKIIVDSAGGKAPVDLGMIRGSAER